MVPRGKAPAANPLDVRGLTLSTLAALVYTVIEAPNKGWGSASTLVGFAIALAAAMPLSGSSGQHRADARRTPVRQPALHRSVRRGHGRVLRALGFIFLITQYMQILRRYSALPTGVRILPVAIAIAVTSGLGTVLAVRIGNKIVIAAGLLLVEPGSPGSLRQTRRCPIPRSRCRWSCWVRAGTHHGAGHRSHHGCRPARAGRRRSAVNDATREVGGTLGVAIIGSVYASLYRSKLDSARVPAAALDMAKGSFGASRAAAAQLPSASAQELLSKANSGFLDGLHAGCGVAAAACAVGALIVVAFLLAFRGDRAHESTGPLRRTCRDTRRCRRHDRPGPANGATPAAGSSRC